MTQFLPEKRFIHVPAESFHLWTGEGKPEAVADAGFFGSPSRFRKVVFGVFLFYFSSMRDFEASND